MDNGADLQSEQGRLVGSYFSSHCTCRHTVLNHSDGCYDCHLHRRCPLAQLLLTFPLNRALYFVVVFLPHLFLIRVYNFQFCQENVIILSLLCFLLYLRQSSPGWPWSSSQHPHLHMVPSCAPTSSVHSTALHRVAQAGPDLPPNTHTFTLCHLVLPHHLCIPLLCTPPTWWWGKSHTSVPHWWGLTPTEYTARFCLWEQETWLPFFSHSFI